MSNSSKYNINAETVQITEQNHGTIIGKQVNQTADPAIQQTIADLKTLLTQLQIQHPTVTTETQALTVLDAEFTVVRQSGTSQLVTLRQQLLNPERHAQAIKATIVEMTKHQLEHSVWVKALITYFDKLSEEPNYGD